MPQTETEFDGKPAGRRSNPVVQRLVMIQWVALAAICLGVLAVWQYEVPVQAAIVGVLAILVAALAGQRRHARKTLAAAKRSDFRRLWPGTGMKVAIDAFPSPCFVADSKGVTRFVNEPAAAAYEAVKPGDPLSFGLRTPVLLEAFDRVCSQLTPERIEWSEKVPTESWFEAYMAPMFYPKAGASGKRSGDPDFILVVIRDLTEQRRLERMRTDFVANASHELRTPLASLTGFIETLQGPAKDDPVARDRFLGIMHDQSARMKRLIDDILSLSRIELKAHVRPSTDLDLGEIVRHTADALAPLAKDLDVELVLTLPEAPVLVKGERDELIQVVENLVENALKYGSEGKKVEVGLLQSADTSGSGQATISVRDFGPGIPPEHLPRLTERFYRVDAVSSRAMKGTGLGLAIVKHILARHRARLEIKSNLGEGACFKVHFEDE